MVLPLLEETEELLALRESLEDFRRRRRLSLCLFWDFDWLVVPEESLDLRLVKFTFSFFFFGDSRKTPNLFESWICYSSDSSNFLNASADFRLSTDSTYQRISY